MIEVPEPNLKGRKKPAKKRTTIKECDVLFSKVVRRRDGHCQRCGSTLLLQCAHIFTRGYRRIRFDERNAIALCKRCHMFFTPRPIEWEDWVKEKYGGALWDQLRLTARCGALPDLDDVKADLTHLLEVVA